MIYVNVEGVKPNNAGRLGGNQWYNTESVLVAVVDALEDFHRICDESYERPVTYQITVATEDSPRRTKTGLLPLPVK